MSKDQDENKSVNYSDYTYLPEDTITMSAQEFIVLRKGLEKALSNGVEGKYPQVLRFFNLKTGEPTENPTDKQLQSGEVRQFADNGATFSDENMHISYNANVYPEIFNALNTQMVVHQRMVDDGVAKTSAEVKKVYEERQAQGQMKVQSDDEPKGTMNVVKE